MWQEVEFWCAKASVHKDVTDSSVKPKMFGGSASDSSVNLKLSRTFNSEPQDQRPKNQ